MILYHGSNIAIKEPKIIISGRKLDFGTGFYLTSSYEQAQRWAKLKKERSEQGTATVSVYEIEDKLFETLKIRHFEKANAQWLKYIAANRQGTSKPDNSDIVIGPVANDQTMPTLSRFLIGDLTVLETIKRLKTQVLKDQYVFKTEKALKLLQVKEFIENE